MFAGLFSTCSHEYRHSKVTYGGFWGDKPIPWHKCEKCGKEEKCVIDGGNGPYLGRGVCHECGWNKD